MPQTRSRSGAEGTTGKRRSGTGGNGAGATAESEQRLRAMKVDDLRKLARSHKISGTTTMRKDDLVKEISAAQRGGKRRGGAKAGAATEQSGNGQKVRHGRNSSKSLKALPEDQLS